MQTQRALSLALALLAALPVGSSVGCQSVPLAPDPVTLGDTPACPAVFTSEVGEVQWRKNVVTAGRIGGIVLAAGGPAVAIGGIALDDQPATPPVEAFVLGGAMSTAGVIAVVMTGIVADDAELHAKRARAAYANACPG
jgi:hypothetical protein